MYNKVCILLSYHTKSDRLKFIMLYFTTNYKSDLHSSEEMSQMKKNEPIPDGTNSGILVFEEN